MHHPRILRTKMLTDRSDIENLIFTPSNNTADDEWNIVIFPPVSSTIDSNMTTSISNGTMQFESDLVNTSILRDQELWLSSQPSSMDSSIIWTIFCDFLGAPFLIAFLYVLYRGIEVGWFV